MGSFYEEAIRNVLQEEYNITTTKLRRLDGRADLTFVVNDNEHVIKLFLDPVAQDRRHVEAEIGLINHLHKSGLPVARVLPTKRGDFYAETEVFDEPSNTKIKRFFRLQAFLQGVVWLGQPLNEAFCSSAGSVIGRMMSAMASYQNPFYKERPNLLHVLEISEEFKVSKLISLVEDDTVKLNLCKQVVSIFEDVVVRHIEDLPKQLIHGDCQTVNMLISKDFTQVLGIVDFTDARYSCRIFEAAIILLAILGHDKTDDYEMVRTCMKALKQHVEISELEFQALEASIYARGILVMLLGRHYERVGHFCYNEQNCQEVHGPIWRIISELLTNQEKRSKLQLALRDL